MSLQVNHSAIAHAKSLARAGKIDRGEWDGTKVGRSQANSTSFAAVNTDHSPDEEGHWQYPFIAEGKVSAKGIASAIGYAKKNGADELASALQELSDLIHKPVQASRAVFFDIQSSFAAALVMDRGYPKEVHGRPCLYFKKEMARVEDIHGVNGQKQIVDADRLNRLANNTNRRISKGNEPYLSLGRHFNKVDSPGRLKAVEFDGKSLYGIHQFIGDETAIRQMVATNESSIGTAINVIDTDGEVYDEIIDHNCICPDPQWNGLKTFEPIDPTQLNGLQPALAASRGLPIEAVSLQFDRRDNTGATMAQEITQDHVDRTKKLMKDMGSEEAAGDVDTTNAMDKLLSHCSKMNKKGLTLSREDLDASRDVTSMENLTADQAVPALVKKAKDLTAENLQLSRDFKAIEKDKKDADARVLELSRENKTPPPPTQRELNYAGIAAMAAREKAVASGAITAFVADQAEATYLKRPVDFKTLTLSRDVQDGDSNLLSGIDNLVLFYKAVQGNTPSPVIDNGIAATDALLLGRSLPPGTDPAKQKEIERQWEEEENRAKAERLAQRGLATA